MRGYTHWTGKRIKRLRELAPSGLGTEAIADIINAEFGTTHTVRAINQKASVLGIPIARTIREPKPRERAPRLWTDEENRIARTFLANGASPVMVSLEIYEATGKYRSEFAVRDRARLKGWSWVKRFRRWTPQEDAELRFLLASGLDQQGIADAMGLPKKRVKHRMGKLRLSVNPVPRWSELRKARLKGLVQAGLSASEIGAAMGISKSTVIGQCSRQGYRLALSPGHKATRHVSMGATHGASS